MSLTSTEEALVRQLLDQQAAILSLAGNEATITSKLGATKVTLSDLVSASAVADADLLLMRQGTNDKSVTPLLLRSYTQDGMATQKGVQAGDYNTSVAGGTADALTGDYTPNPIALEDGLTLFVRATAANATTTPTFAPDGLAAKTIVKGNNLPLSVGDISGAGHWLQMTYDSLLDKWVLQNPATGVAVQTPTNANFVINGGFDIWQRGTSGGAINSYLADRWKTNSATTTARSTDVPAGSLYSLAMTGTAGNIPAVETPLELKGTGSLAPFKTNTDYTVSFKVKASVGSNIAIRARFADGAWGTNVIDVLPLTNIAVATGSWQTVSYTFNSGATVPNGTNKCLALMVSAGAAASTANVAQVKLEESSKATPFNFQQIADVLAQCHRYYISGFAPRARNPATSTATVLGGVSFPTVMRAAPTVTMTPAGSGPDTSAGAFGFSTQQSVAGSSTGTSFAYTADAEL